MSEKKNKDAMGPEEHEKLQVARVKPFTKYKAAELIVCGLAVILGLLYLYADFLSLSVLLPSFSCAFAAVTVLRWLDTRAVGGRGFIAMLPVVCWAVLTAAVIIATGAYFSGTLSLNPANF